jgi:hypothetical protein
MANWEGVKEFLRENYNLSVDEEDSLEISFEDDVYGFDVRKMEATNGGIWVRLLAYVGTTIASSPDYNIDPSEVQWDKSLEYLIVYQYRTGGIF